MSAGKHGKQVDILVVDDDDDDDAVDGGGPDGNLQSALQKPTAGIAAATANDR